MEASEVVFVFGVSSKICHKLTSAILGLSINRIKSDQWQEQQESGGPLFDGSKGRDGWADHRAYVISAAIATKKSRVIAANNMPETIVCTRVADMESTLATRWLNKRYDLYVLTSTVCGLCLQ